MLELTAYKRAGTRYRHDNRFRNKQVPSSWTMRRVNTITWVVMGAGGIMDCDVGECGSLGQKEGKSNLLGDRDGELEVNGGDWWRDGV